jgi:IS1 family transposase
MNTYNPLFRQLYSICNKTLLSRDEIEEIYIGNFMVIRWLSFLVGDQKTKRALTQYLNNINKGYVFTDKYDAYLYLFHTIPKIPKPKFDYISKKKIEEKYGKDEETKLQKEKKQKVTTFLAQSLEISEREIKYLIEKEYVNVNQIYKIIL